MKLTGNGRWRYMVENYDTGIVDNGRWRYLVEK